EKAMKQMSDQGFSLKSYWIGEPGEFFTEANNTFVVVPTKLEMTVPGGRMMNKSYLLGISPDGGKMWTFVDGAGLHDQASRDKVLPKLPAKLVLPAKQNAE